MYGNKGLRMQRPTFSIMAVAVGRSSASQKWHGRWFNSHSNSTTTRGLGPTQSYKRGRARRRFGNKPTRPSSQPARSISAPLILFFLFFPCVFSLSFHQKEKWHLNLATNLVRGSLNYQVVAREQLWVNNGRSSAEIF